jgi:hypothetical protein
MSSRPRQSPDALRAFVVLGYGCHVTPMVRRFLDAVAVDILELTGGGPTASGASAVHVEPLLITSGGFTNPRSAPGVSEARAFARYLSDRGVELETLLDEDALTTLHNLRGVSALLGPRGIAAEQIVICCDAARRAKIAHVARPLLGGSPTLWTYDFGRTRAQTAVQQTLGLLFDAAALRVPWVERISWRWVLRRNAQR